MQTGPMGPRGTPPIAQPQTNLDQTATPQETSDPAPAVQQDEDAFILGGSDDEERGGFGSWLGGLKNTLQAATGPELTPERREALQTIHDMLEPDKLGGEDRTFNFGDRDAVVRGLMRDTQGLKEEVTQRLREEGKPFQARIAGAGLDGRRGPLKRLARNKVCQEAPAQIQGQLDQGLRDAHIDPKTGQTPDNRRRNLTFGDLRRFEAATKVLDGMQQEVRQKIGMDVHFPGGISQAAIRHTMDGAIGVPPGGKLVPIEED